MTKIMKECINYQKIKDNKVQCRACSHFCLIDDGNVGICGIRKNTEGRLNLLAYGKAIAVNIDPIEKKPLFHFLPGSKSFSFGTIGCNFRCGNCQNFDISQMYSLKGKVGKYGEIDWGYDLPPEEIVKEAIAKSCASIAYTYNEPTVFLEYALDTMKIAREQGIKNVWVSNGFMSKETLDSAIPYLDAANVDIKSFDDKFYRDNCGAKVRPVLDNCIRLAKEKIWLEVTTLVIPDMSDDEVMLRDIARFIKNELGGQVPWHVSAFSGRISWKLQNVPDTPLEKIKRCYEIGKEEGLKYVYAGNVWDTDLESTFCPSCGQVAVRRVGYSFQRSDEQGKCKNCGRTIEGIL